MDSDHFLTDVFEQLIEDMRQGNRRNPPTGDPVRLIDHAIDKAIDLHSKVLRDIAQQHRTAILDMAEEFKEKNKDKRPGQQHDLVRTRWATSESYDRRR
jgi:hypothetical protein